MGRPSKIKALPAGTSRRGFFKQAGGAAAAATVAPMLALSGAANAAAPLFQHGVASGDPLFDRVILWTRVSPAAGRSVVVVSYVIAIDPGMTQVAQRGSVKTNPARDYTVKVDVTGLVPNNTYYYRFTADGETSPIGRTKTLPVGSTPRLRMAVVSCSNHAYGYFNVYARIAQRADLDLVMHLGDYIYEYGANQYGTARTPEPAVEIVTLNDYRNRHAQYKRDADSQAMHRQHPLVCIWDDHETANNSWQGGAENHTPSTEGAWSARVDAALQAYYEWMPVRVVDTTNYRKNNRSYTYGDLAELVMLEERVNARSEQLGTNIGNASGYFIQAGPYLDSARQLLGVTQEAWLFDKLRTANARWKLLGQGVMFAQLKVRGGANAAGGGVYFNSDAWDGYQPARDRVFEVIKGGNGQPAVNNVVVLTGDIHSAWAADLTQDPNNADVASGGYDAATGTGSRAVEFVGTSVSSPGIADPTGAIANSLLPANPHFKYINLDKRGYMIVDITHQRALAEWWFVDTVATPSSNESFGVAYATLSGSNHLVSASQTTPALNPAPLAP